jgi:hypothetical protein
VVARSARSTATILVEAVVIVLLGAMRVLLAVARHQRIPVIVAVRILTDPLGLGDAFAEPLAKKMVSHR